EYLDTLQKQQYILPVFQSFAQTRKEEIIDMLIPEEGWDYEFCEQRELTGFAWIECPECKGLDIHYMHSWHHVCNDGKERILLYRYSKQYGDNESAEAREIEPDAISRIYCKQSDLVKDMVDEITEKTLHDTAIPWLQVLGYLEVEELPGKNCYILHIGRIFRG